MNRLVIMFGLLALPAAADAQWKPYPQVLQLEVKGDGAWAVSCQLQDRGGNPVTRELSENGRDRFNLTVRGGQCTYKAAPDEPLRISIAGDYVCTLPSPEEGRCRQTFPAGASGQFEIRRRSETS
jgi:hypothetical protein